MQLRKFTRRRPAGFTLLELLVSVAISVILVSILSFVFTTSINATRATTGRVAVTERMRGLNIRLRQEIGAMLPVPRTQDAGDPVNPGMGFDYYVSPSGDELTFTTSTDEFGKPVTVDVRYKLEADPNFPGRSMLVRYRDSSGPYDPVDPTKLNLDPLTSAWKCKLGDYNFVTPALQSDIMISNIITSSFKFTAINPPAAAVTGDTALYPRTLPSAVALTLTFSPEVGDPNLVQSVTLTFPVYRGL